MLKFIKKFQLIDFTVNENNHALFLIIPFIILLSNWLINGVCFETNDDYAMMAIVSGMRTGTPMPDTMFCNIIWGMLLSCLYRISGAISWYAIIYFLIIYFSLCVVYKNCLYLFDYKFIFGTFIFVCVYYSIFYWYSIILQFTTIPAYSGMAALLLMSRVENDEAYLDKKTKAFILLSFFAIILRTDVGYLFTLALILYGLSLRFFYKKKTEKFIIIGVIIQGVTWFINFVYMKTTEWGAFVQYNAQRAKWTDYPRLQYEDNPELYNSLGWTKWFYDLADNWFFLDEHFTKESLKTINNAYSESTNILTRYSIRELVHHIIEAGNTCLFFSLIIIVMSIILVSIKLKKIRELVIVVAYCAFSLILLLYLAAAGRLLFRVLFAIILLFVVPSIFVVLSEEQSKKLINTTLIIKHDLFIVGCLLIIFSVCSNEGLYRNAINYEKENEENKTNGELLNELAIKYPNSYFIYDYSLRNFLDPFATYPKEKPSNIKFWGGWETNSPIDMEQIHVNGFDKMYAENFFDERVFFVSKSNCSDIEELLLPYMQDRFSECYLETILIEDKYTVYQFRK